MSNDVDHFRNQNKYFELCSLFYDNFSGYMRHCDDKNIIVHRYKNIYVIIFLSSLSNTYNTKEKIDT